MNQERMFPIQGDTDTETRIRRPAGSVPWSVAEEAYKVYSEWFGTSQSLERLAERGGFSWHELVRLLQRDRDFTRLPATKAQ